MNLLKPRLRPQRKPKRLCNLLWRKASMMHWMTSRRADSQWPCIRSLPNSWDVTTAGRNTKSGSRFRPQPSRNVCAEGAPLRPTSQPQWQSRRVVHYNSDPAKKSYPIHLAHLDENNTSSHVMRISWIISSPVITTFLDPDYSGYCYDHVISN